MLAYTPNYNVLSGSMWTISDREIRKREKSMNIKTLQVTEVVNLGHTHTKPPLSIRRPLLVLTAPEDGSRSNSRNKNVETNVHY
jgi:hypothetical protein